SERNRIGASMMAEVYPARGSRRLGVGLLLAHHGGQKGGPPLLLGLGLVLGRRLDARGRPLDGAAPEQGEDLLAAEGLVLEQRLGDPLEARLVLVQEAQGPVVLLGDDAPD